MQTTQYQEATRRTAIYPGQGTVLGLSYCVHGLTGEAGEIANKFKKILRDDNGEISEEKRRALLDECGDALWYLARIVDELESTLNFVAIQNIEKLTRRKENGALVGTGDKR